MRSRKHAWQSFGWGPMCSTPSLVKRRALRTRLTPAIFSRTLCRCWSLAGSSVRRGSARAAGPSLSRCSPRHPLNRLEPNHFSLYSVMKCPKWNNGRKTYTDISSPTGCINVNNSWSQLPEFKLYCACGSYKRTWRQSLETETTPFAILVPRSLYWYDNFRPGRARMAGVSLPVWIFFLLLSKNQKTL